MRIGTLTQFVNESTVNLPYLNVMHSGSRWFTYLGGSDTNEELALDQLYTDSNGNVTSVDGSLHSLTFTSVKVKVLQTGVGTLYGKSYPIGRYVLLYDGSTGSGTFTFDQDFTKLAEGAPAGGAGTGRILLSASGAGSGTFVTLTGTGSPYPTNIRLVYAPTAKIASLDGVNVIDPNETKVTAAQCSITGAANNGSGIIRLAFSAVPSLWQTGTKLFVGGVSGTTEANGTWTVTVIDGTHVDLQGSTFSNAYTSGGCAGDLLQAFADDYTTKIGAFDLIRFQGWADYGSDGESTLTDRRNPFSLYWSIYAPFEIMVAFCNLVSADMWYSMPALALDAHASYCATYAASYLNAPLKLYYEYSNEWWGKGTTYGNRFQRGQIHGFIDDGSGAGTYSGVAGSILTVTSFDTFLGAASVIKIGTDTNDMDCISDSAGDDDLAFGIPAVLSQTTSAGGHNRYILSQVPVSSVWSGMNVAPTTLYLHRDIWHCMQARGLQTYPSIPANDASPGFQWAITRLVQCGHIFKSAFSDPTRCIVVAGGQTGNEGFGGVLDYILGQTPDGPGLGGPSFWYGSTAGAVSTHVDAVAGAAYFTPRGDEPTPSAWSADSTGLTRFMTELKDGGQIPLTTGPTVAPHALGGSSPNRTLTSDADWGAGAIPSTPAAMQMVRFTTAGAITAGDKLSVDGGTQFFLKDDTGGTSNLPTGAGTYVACFTTATAQGVVSPGQWRVLFYPYCGYPGGQIYYVLSLVQATITYLQAAHPTLEYVLYEFGMQATGGGQNPLDERPLYQAASRDSRMYDVLTKHMNNLAGLAHGPTLACFTNDITFYGTSPTAADSWYGALENSGDPITAPNVPKYRALMDFIAANAGTPVGYVNLAGPMRFRLHS